MAAQFTFWRELDPEVQNRNPNGFGISPTGDIYVAQSDPRADRDVEDLTISRFDASGFASKMTGLFGHGGNVLVQRGETDYVLVEYFVTNTTTGKVTDKQWVRLPFTADRVWTQAAALAYAVTTPNFPTIKKASGWFQSYTLAFQDTHYLLYGSAYGNKGSEVAKGVPGRVDIVRNGKVAGSINVADLARDDKTGKPRRGRLEPEGITLHRINGQMHLVISIVTGTQTDGRRIRLYRMPLEAATSTQPSGQPAYGNGRSSFVAPYTRRANPPGTLARFVVCDTLTNKVLGEIKPNGWELTDPAAGSAGFGTLTIPIPGYDQETGKPTPLDSTGRRQLTRLKHLTRPRIRWVAAMDTNGNVIWAGPIQKAPAKQGPTITVPLIDWRGWFYRTYLRPTSGGAVGDYIANNVDQATIIKTLITKAYTSSKATPGFAVDDIALTKVKRDFTGAQLDQSIGALLDDIAGRERGAEWFTYAVAAEDGSHIQPHVRVAYPERTYRRRPFRIQWKEGVGGNCFDVSWPEPEEAFSRVWAISSAEPPAQTITSDVYDEIVGTNPTDILWETTLGPLDGVKKRATAFEYAYAAIEQSRRVGGQAEVSITEERLKFGSYEPGDRAQTILDDGWNTADIPAARILQRVLSGGQGKPTVQRLTLDLTDAHYPDDGADPGEELTIDG